MRIPDFKLERYFARWEFKAPLLLCTSDIEGWRMSELLALADGDGRERWERLTLGYAEPSGLPALREELARLYQGVGPEQVLTFAGAQEALFVLMNVLLGARGPRGGDVAGLAWCVSLPRFCTHKPATREAVSMKRRRRRSFAPEFKAEAVQLVREGSKRLPQVAKALNLTESALRNWVKERAGGEGKAQRALGVALTLGSLVCGGCATPTVRQPGTPMKTSCPASVELPTVEECLEEASRIDEELLMNCMRRQCRDITMVCSEWGRQKCKEYNQYPGGILLAFTETSWKGVHHRFYPVDKTHWCEKPASRKCIAQAVIHELAHSCGWDHRQGHNVPGNDPEKEPPCECACVDENGTSTSCN